MKCRLADSISFAFLNSNSPVNLVPTFLAFFTQFESEYLPSWAGCTSHFPNSGNAEALVAAIAATANAATRHSPSIRTCLTCPLLLFLSLTFEQPQPSCGRDRGAAR